MNSAILADAAAGRFARWGRSTSRDEHSGEPVVSAAVMRELHGLAGLETDGEVGNAGLIHVYGYLLSDAVTPYGPKRARWTEGRIAAALGLDPALLLPDPERDAQGATPLARLTPLLEGLLAAPPPGAAVVEEAGRRLLARTVVLDLGDGALLVYGIRLDPAGPVLPVTVFPVVDAASTVAAIEGEPPRLRYNAVDEEGRARTPLDSRELRRSA